MHEYIHTVSRPSPVAYRKEPKVTKTTKRKRERENWIILGLLGCKSEC